MGNKCKKYLFFVIVYCGLIGCQKNIEVVSLIKVLSAPDQYDGEEIIVSGYLVWEFENQALYLTGEYASYGFSESAIWVNVSTERLELINPKNVSDMENKIEDLNGRYVRLVGIFKSPQNSSGGEFVGEILANRISILVGM